MPRPYPDDLRMHAVKRVLAGESRCSVAKQIGVAVSTVIKWVQLYLETGSVSPRQMGGYRKRWKRYQDKADSRKLVFIDETGTKTNMSPRCGWGPKGERVQRLGSLRPLGDLDIHRRSAARPDRRPLGPGRTGQRRRLPALCRNATGPDAQPRRHRHHGQPRQPQDQSGARGDPRRRRPPAVPSALQSRSQPDRAGVRQTQALPAQGPAANSGRSLEKHRLNPEEIRTRRMRQLSRELRIWSTSN